MPFPRARTQATTGAYPGSRTISLRAGRLDSAHQSRRQPRAAPPHPPPEIPTGDVRHTELREMLLVQARGPQIGNYQTAPWTEHSYCLRKRLASTGPTLDVVERHVRNNEIEASIFERQCRHVRRLDLHAVGDTLSDGVAPRDLDFIPRLVGTLPDIHPNRTTGRQMSRCQEQHRAPTAPEIQNPLVAMQLELPKQLGPDLELAATRRVQTAAGASQYGQPTDEGPCCQDA